MHLISMYSSKKKIRNGFFSLVNCVLHPIASDPQRVYSVYMKSISRDLKRFVICMSSREGNLALCLKSHKLIEPL